MTSFDIFHDGKCIQINLGVKYEISMIDGKVSNALVGNTATLRCQICFLTTKNYHSISPTSFNHETDQIKNRLKLCLSPLHSSFKLFDFLLKLSKSKKQYEFIQKNPQATKNQIADILNGHINNYEKKFWELTKAQIDFIKPGYGKSTTGQNVKRAMQDPELTAAILDLETKFVNEVNNIAKFLNSLEPVSKQDWYNSVDYVFEHYNQNFSRFANLSPSVHKIICHGWQMIERLSKPPGFYSEQSQEKLNKKFRDIRDNNSRKMSFGVMLEDIFVYFYVNSDPFIFKNEFF